MKVKKILDKLQSLVNSCGLTKKNLVIVKDPYLYAQRHNIKGIKIGDIAFAIPKKKLIIIKSVIEEKDIQTYISATEFRVESPCIKKLKDVEFFIKHLVLHETGHIVEGIPQEKDEEADAYAFKKLGCKVTGIITKQQLREMQ